MLRATIFKLIRLICSGVLAVACQQESDSNRPGAPAQAPGTAGGVNLDGGPIGAGPTGDSSAVGAATLGDAAPGSAAMGGAAGNGATMICTPNRADFDGRIKKVLQDRCGLCHGLPPAFGAPFTLLDYDSLIKHNDAGGRNVDRIVGKLSAGTMPPPGNVQPTPAEFKALTQWASCGAAAPDYPSKQQASREILSSPGSLPQGLTAVPMLANQFELPVGPDHFQDFVFDRVVDRDVFVRRIEAKIDNAAVLHHIILTYNNGTGQFLYTWGPGTGGIEFPDGGLRIRPSDSFAVNIHYSNRLGAKNMRDSSGVVLYTGPAQGTEYKLLDPGSFDIMVPPLSDATTTVTCTAESDFDIFAGMPHMHEIGRSLRHELHRKNGGTETIIQVDNWYFSLQYFYKMGINVRAGDTMTVTCNYRNESSRPVVGGQGTTDEMCFSFLYASPANAKLNCAGRLHPDGLVCKSAADCGPDQTCCAVWGDPPTSACQAKTSECPSTPFGPITLCDTPAECTPPGTTCGTTPLDPVIKVCGG